MPGSRTSSTPGTGSTGGTGGSDDVVVDASDDAPAPTSAEALASRAPSEVADDLVDDLVDGELAEDPDDAPTDPDELWQAFHQVVNMTSAELEAFLRTSGAGPTSETEPDLSGDETSRTVLSVLGMRRGDVGPHETGVMRHVVHTVRAERGRDADTAPEDASADSAWRHRLMALGHDPLKPAR